MFENQRFWKLNIGGLVIGGLLVFILKDLPLFVLLAAVFLLPYSIYLHSIERRDMEKATIITFIYAIFMSIITLWVYEYFLWPPDLLEVFLLSMQVLMTGEALFSIVYMLLNTEDLKHYLRSEVFLIKVLQLIVSIVGPLTAYGFLGFTEAKVFIIILFVLLWQKIAWEISGIYHG